MTHNVYIIHYVVQNTLDLIDILCNKFINNINTYKKKNSLATVNDKLRRNHLRSPQALKPLR